MATTTTPGIPIYQEADPVGLWGGDNLYSYVSNNPIAYIDPSGLIPKCTSFVEELGSRLLGQVYGAPTPWKKVFGFERKFGRISAKLIIQRRTRKEYERWVTTYLVTIICVDDGPCAKERVTVEQYETNSLHDLYVGLQEQFKGTIFGAKIFETGWFWTADCVFR